MFRLVVLTGALVACSLGQHVDPKNAKILKEQRFNAGDGRNGAAYATENGQVFREEADVDGNRIGQYSYIGDDGKTYTVKYSAGKDGFRILDGSHVPASGQQAAAFVAEPDEPLPAPAPVVPQPQQRVRPVPPQQPVRVAPRPVVPQPEPEFLDYDDTPADPNRNPFINPHDPTHRNFQFNQNAVKFDPTSPLAKQASLVPPCADCAGVNPFVNPFDSTHNNAGVLAGHLAGHLAGVPQARRVPSRPAAPARPAPRPVAPVAPTPPSPTRFFPPGQLKLNRFETGYNFDFES